MTRVRHTTQCRRQHSCLAGTERTAVASGGRLLRWTPGPRWGEAGGSRYFRRVAGERGVGGAVADGEGARAEVGGVWREGDVVEHGACDAAPVAARPLAAGADGEAGGDVEDASRASSKVSSP